MTDTAKMADIVLPATMFVEHDDIYTAGGSQYLLLGPKLIEPRGECRNNHEVICGLGKRLGAEHPGLRHDAARTDRRARCKSPAGARWRNSRPIAGSTASRISRPRITSKASPIPTANSASSRIGPKCRSAAGTRIVTDDAAAGTAGSLAGHRRSRRRTSVPARDLAGARLSQFDLHRDADVALRRAAAGGDDPS